MMEYEDSPWAGALNGDGRKREWITYALLAFVIALALLTIAWSGNGVSGVDRIAPARGVDPEKVTEPVLPIAVEFHAAEVWDA